MYDTPYGSFSQSQVNDLFRSENWDNLSASDRLNACQEAHNRYADEHHMERCEVRTEAMSGTNFGYYSNGAIALNQSVIETGEIVQSDGTRVSYPGSNAETLDTVFHETGHAYDHQLSAAAENQLNGDNYNQALLDDASRQGIDIDLARASDDIYIDVNSNPDMYRVQSCEQRAYDLGEKETAKVFEESNSRNGSDRGFDAYNSRLQLQNSYDESLSNLKLAYGDNNIDKTLNEQTKSLYYGEPVPGTPSGSPSSRAAVRSELSQTSGGRAAAFYEQLGISASHYQSGGNIQTSKSSLSGTYIEGEDKGGQYLASGTQSESLPIANGELGQSDVNSPSYIDTPSSSSADNASTSVISEGSEQEEGAGDIQVSSSEDADDNSYSL